MTTGSGIGIGLLAALVACASPRSVSTHELVEDPTGHDGAAIVLVGSVENPRVEARSDGRDYTAFTLSDGTARVPVIARGTPPITKGDVVEVRGTFRSQLHAGNEQIPDTVEAKDVRVVGSAPKPASSTSVQ